MPTYRVFGGPNNGETISVDDGDRPKWWLRKPRGPISPQIGPRKGEFTPARLEECATLYLVLSVWYRDWPQDKILIPDDMPDQEGLHLWIKLR